MKKGALNLGMLRQSGRLAAEKFAASDKSSASEGLSRREFLGLAIAAPNLVVPERVRLWRLSRILEIEASKHEVAIRLGGVNCFTVCGNVFAGSPRIEAFPEHGHFYVRLRHARYPGLRMPADFDLDMFETNTGWQYNLSLAALESNACGDLMAWLRGDYAAAFRTRSHATVLENAYVRCRIPSDTRATFSSKWRLRLEKPSGPVAWLHGHPIAASSVELSLPSADVPSFLHGRSRRRTQVQFDRGEYTWKVDLPALSDLRVEAGLRTFQSLTVEANENRDSARYGLLFEGGPETESVPLKLSSSVKTDSQFELPLSNLRYASYPETGEVYLSSDIGPRTPLLRLGAFTYSLTNREGAPSFEAFRADQSSSPTVTIQPVASISTHLPGAVVRTIRAPKQARFRLNFCEAICDLREALHIFPEKKIAYTMSDSLEIDILRPRDMLTLQMKFKGLHFEHHRGKTWLVPGAKHLDHPDAASLAAAKCAAKIIVELPPQMISEEAACEDSVDITSAPPPPIKSCIAGQSRLVFRPFSTSSADRLPFELDSLLGWSNWGLNVSNLAAPPLLPDGTFSPDGRLVDGFSYKGTHPSLTASELAAQCLDSSAKPAPPAEDETAIEAPEGLIISPNRYAIFDVIVSDAEEKAGTSPQATARTALWHTRLRTPEPQIGMASPQPDQCPLLCGSAAPPAKSLTSLPRSKPRYPATRILWAPQIDPSFDKTRYPLYQRSAAITPSDQISLAQAFVKWDPAAKADNNSPYYPPAIPTSLLVLSAKGGWMRGAVTWEPLLGTNLSGLSLRLAEGHNEKTVIAKDGFLMPSGHASTLIKETSRKWVSLNGTVYSYEVMVCYLTFPEKNKAYPAVGQANGARDLCYQTWTITIDRTPNLDFPDFPGNTPNGCDCSGEGAFWPKVQGVEYRIPFSAVDLAKATCTFSLPVMWVPSNIGLDIGQAAPKLVQYGLAVPFSLQNGSVVNPDDTHSLAEGEWTTELAHDANSAHPISKRLTVAEMHSQKVALAPPSKPGNTQAAVDRLFWAVSGPVSGTDDARRNALQPGWYPVAKRFTVADDNLQAISNPSGTPGQGLLYVNYFGDYVLHGFPSNSGGKGINRGEVYLSVVKEKLLTPPGIDFAAKQSGSIAVPSASTIGFSRSLGPTGGNVTQAADGTLQTTLSDLSSGNFNPIDYFAGKLPKLFGVIDLIEIIAAVTGLDDQLEKIPKLIPTEIRDLAGAIENAITQVQQAIDTANAIAAAFQNYRNMAANAAATLQNSAIQTATTQLVEILGYVDIPDDFIGTAAEVSAKVQQVRGTIASFQSVVNNTDDLSTLREYFIARITANGVLDPGDVDDLRRMFMLECSSHVAGISSAIADAQSRIGNGLAAGEAVRSAATDLLTAAKNKDAPGLAAALNEMQQALELLLGGASIAARAKTEVASVQQQLQSQTSQVLTSATANYGTLKSSLVQYKNGLFSAEAAIVNAKIDAFQTQAQSLLETANNSVNSFINQAATQLNSAVDQTLGAAADLDAQLQPALDLIQMVQELIQLPKEIHLDYAFNPQLRDDPSGIFKADYNGTSATLDISIHIVKKLDGSSPTFQTNVALQNFTLTLLPFLNFVELSFSRVAFSSGSSGGTNVSVKLADASFLGPFDFVQQLEQELGFLDSGSGPLLTVDASGVTLGMQFGFPTVDCGMFLLTGLSFSAGITLPFDGTPIMTSFAFATRDAPAILAFEIFGGGIYLGLKLSARGVVMVEAALEFGAIAELDLVVASGTVSIMGGFYYRKDADSTTLSGFIRASGELTVLDLVSMSMQFWLSLAYEERSTGAWLVGECTIQVEISFAFFSVGASVTMRRDFSKGSGNSAKLTEPAPPDAEPFETLADDWEVEYLRRAARYA
jgi:hypothetical protein